MTMEHDLRQAALLADRLHAEVMNLPCEYPASFLQDDEWARYAYTSGHKDARHAAAELVVAALSAIEAVQEKGEKGNLVYRSAADLPAASGSDVPARPTSPAEDARIDPMQNPMRPAYAMNFADNETEAENVLRKLACWLGVGGYNAPTVDAEVFHRKIVDGIEMLLQTARSADYENTENIAVMLQRKFCEVNGIALAPPVADPGQADKPWPFTGCSGGLAISQQDEEDAP